MQPRDKVPVQVDTGRPPPERAGEPAAEDRTELSEGTGQSALLHEYAEQYPRPYRHRRGEGQGDGHRTVAHHAVCAVRCRPADGTAAERDGIHRQLHPSDEDTLCRRGGDTDPLSGRPARRAGSSAYVDNLDGECLQARNELPGGVVYRHPADRGGGCSLLYGGEQRRSGCGEGKRRGARESPEEARSAVRQRRFARNRYAPI